MKNILLAMFISFSAVCFSQNPVLINTNLLHDTCLDKKFSIVFYILLDSNYTVGSATQPTIDLVMDELNKVFQPICVSFMNCSTVHIPYYYHSRKWRKEITDPIVVNNWYTPKTINIYLVDSIKSGYSFTETVVGGYTYPPPVNPGDTTKDVFVMEKEKLINPNFQAIMHSFGHYFGLTHTEDELNAANPATPMPASGILSQEFADGSNNAIHGDLIPDTEADPGASSAQTTDGNGNYYIPPIDNYMSGYSTAGRFTQQQLNFMAHKILTQRLYLH